MNCLILTPSLALAACFHFSSDTGKSSCNIPTTQPGKGLVTEGIRGRGTAGPGYSSYLFLYHTLLERKIKIKDGIRATLSQPWAANCMWKSTWISHDSQDDHLPSSSTPQYKRQTHQSPCSFFLFQSLLWMQCHAAQLPTLLLVLKVSRSIFKPEIIGSFANTYRLHTQCTRLCLQRAGFFKNRPTLSCGFGWNFFGFLFKCFGLTCESADPVVCTASGPLTWGENEEEVRHTTRNRQTTSGEVFSALGKWIFISISNIQIHKNKDTYNVF